jgi:two-component system sensor histidine kinase DegS
MNKISEYVKVELANLGEEKAECRSQINRDKNKIASIDEMIQRISEHRNNPGNVFKAVNSDDTNVDKEIASLNEQKEILQKDIAVKEKRLTIIENKISNLNNARDKEVSEEHEILNVRDNERERITRDIHDCVLQKMTSIIHKTEFAQHMVDTDPQRTKLELEIIGKTVRECIDELRNIIYDLRPMSFEDVGFKDSLAQYVKKCSADSGIKFTLDYDDTISNADVDSIILVSVFRIIQELSNNSIKHSNGKHVKIGVYYDKGNIIIKHSDDGVGVGNSANDNDKNDSKGFGISIVHERVRLLKGTLDCDDKKGTSYLITIPCLLKS